MLPILFSSDLFVIYTYPVCFALAWAAGIQYVWFQLVDSKKSFSIFCVISFLAAWAGAKLFFLISTPSEFLGIIDQFNFWTGGGFVFYGGMIAGLVVALIGYFLNKNYFPMGLLIPALCLGHSIGRIGCFLTGCCHGLIMKSGEYFPAALFEAIFLSILFVYFHKRKNENFLLILKDYLLAYAIIRFGLEFLRGDQIRGIYGSFSTSQWISIVIIFIYPFLNIFFYGQTKTK